LTPTSDAARIGVFGGTFDPVHEGHLEVARECAEKLDLDPVLMVPSSLPPHRHAPLASAPDRLAMVKLAVEGHPRLRASDVEVRRGGVSYTVDTIRAFADEYPWAELTLLLGWDAALDFGTWHDSVEIRRRARIAVFNRAGSPRPDPAEVIRLGLPGDAIVLEVDSPLVSSTAVRRALAHEGPGGDVLPPAVRAYIRQHGLYQE